MIVIDLCLLLIGMINDCNNLCCLCCDYSSDTYELILQGDIFDNWNFPHNIKPPTMDELLTLGTAKKVVSAVNELISSAVRFKGMFNEFSLVKVIYSSGNHDMGMNQDICNKYMPEITFIGNTRFNSGRLQAEHGNEYCLFCSSDPNRENNLPLGYFISRLAITADRDIGSHQISTEALIYEVLKIVEHKENVVLAVFDAICTKANVLQSDKIIMPNDIWGGVSISISDIRTMYKNLYQEYEKRCGEVMALLSIPAELNDLGLVASILFLRGGINAIIMGHTHIPVIHEITIPILGRVVYLNSGCWSNRTPIATWVEVIKDDTGSEYTIHGCSDVDDNGELTNVKPFLDSIKI